MANYQLEQTGAEVQALLNAVESPDTTPAAGSSNLITSGAVQAAVAGVSAEVTALGQKVTDLEDKTNTAIAHTKNLADYASVMVGLFPNASGTIAADAQVKSIKFPCKPSTTYTISKVVTKRFRVAYYNTDPVLLTQGAGTITNNAASAITITTAADSSYIVAYIYDGSVETLTMDEILASLQIEEGSVATSYETPGWTAIDKVARERLDPIEESVSENSDDIKELQEILTNTTRGLETTDVVTGSYWSIAGRLATLGAYFHSNPIKLHKGDRIATNTAIPTIAAVSYITKVDAENNFIAVLKPGTGETEMIDFTIPEDGYFSVSALNTQRTLFVIYQNGIENRMDGLVADVASVSPAADTKLPAITDNPLSTIRRDPGYGAIIRKWGIIGDSLSSGEMQCYNEESTSSSDYKFIDMYQYSTGQVLARLLGAEAYNFSNGGQTTWGWLKSQGIVRDETYIGGVGGGDWRLAQQSEYIKDGYIIAMGVNDRGKIVNGDYELGTTSQITTYNGTNSDIDDTTTYPKSFVRYYAGIIQRILSVQPKAKIFCVTMPGDNYAEIAQAIRDIVTYFGGNVYLMDIREYIPDGHDVAGFKLQGHLSPMGYAYWAYMYNTYIDWIIRNNGNAFRDTALIGTDYRPDYS